MSNIRGVNDIRNNNRNQNNSNFSNINFFGSPPSGKDPKDETFWDMLYLNLCPQLVFCSFSVIFVIFILSTFVLQLSLDGISREDEKLKTSLLPVDLVNGSFSSNLYQNGESIKNDY